MAQQELSEMKTGIYPGKRAGEMITRAGANPAPTIHGLGVAEPGDEPIIVDARILAF